MVPVRDSFMHRSMSKRAHLAHCQCAHHARRVHNNARRCRRRAPTLYIRTHVLHKLHSARGQKCIRHPFDQLLCTLHTRTDECARCKCRVAILSVHVMGAGAARTKFIRNVSLMQSNRRSLAYIMSAVCRSLRRCVDAVLLIVHTSCCSRVAHAYASAELVLF